MQRVIGVQICLGQPAKTTHTDTHKHTPAGRFAHINSRLLTRDTIWSEIPGGSDTQEEKSGTMQNSVSPLSLSLFLSVRLV